MKTGTKSNIHCLETAEARLRAHAAHKPRYKVRVSVLDTRRSNAEAYRLIGQMNESQVDKFTKKLTKELRKYA